MIWNDIKINIPLFECKDSLLFDSGEVIATLTSSNDICVTLAVIGDIKIEFENEIYNTPRKYPSVLINAIKDGLIYRMENEGIVKILNNNWFEISVSKNGEIVHSDVWEMSFENLSDEGLKTLFIDYVESSFSDLID